MGDKNNLKKTGLAELVSNDASLISAAYGEVNGKPTEGKKSGVGMYDRIRGFFDDIELRYWKWWMEGKGILPVEEEKKRERKLPGYSIRFKIEY